MKNVALSTQEKSTETPKPLNDLYQRALDLHRRNFFDDAVVLYNKILYTDQNHARAMHFLGMTHFAKQGFAFEFHGKSDGNVFCTDCLSDFITIIVLVILSHDFIKEFYYERPHFVHRPCS